MSKFKIRLEMKEYIDNYVKLNEKKKCSPKRLVDSDTQTKENFNEEFRKTKILIKEKNKKSKEVIIKLNKMMNFHQVMD